MWTTYVKDIFKLSFTNARLQLNWFLIFKKHTHHPPPRPCLAFTALCRLPFTAESLEASSVRVVFSAWLPAPGKLSRRAFPPAALLPHPVTLLTSPSSSSSLRWRAGSLPSPGGFLWPWRQTHSPPPGCFLLALFCWILLIPPTSKHRKTPALKLGALLFTFTLSTVLPSHDFMCYLYADCLHICKSSPNLPPELQALQPSTYSTSSPRGCPDKSHLKCLRLSPHSCFHSSVDSLGKDASVYPGAQTKTLAVIVVLFL